MVDIPYQGDINLLRNLVLGDEAGCSMDEKVDKQSCIIFLNIHLQDITRS